MPAPTHRRLAAAFARYQRVVVNAIPETMTPNAQAHLAFYSGAHAILQILVGIGDGADVTPGDVQVLVDLDLELQEHIAAVTTDPVVAHNGPRRPA